MRAFPFFLSALFAGFTLAGCASADDGHEPDIGSESQAWDSEEGNPTHSSHTYLTDWAIDRVRSRVAEVGTFRSAIVDGANTELHELRVDDPAQESLRREIVGTNWACNRPDVLWKKARERYEAGDRQRAYWYVGVLLHHVEDMGVPAHAFHTIHQGNVRDGDNFERLVLLRWEPDTSTPPRVDPQLAAPHDYVTWNAAWTTSDFRSAFPGERYTTSFFHRTWLFASTEERRFARKRQGRTAYAIAWALGRAAALLTGAR